MSVTARATNDLMGTALPCQVVLIFVVYRSLLVAELAFAIVSEDVEFIVEDRDYELLLMLLNDERTDFYSKLLPSLIDTVGNPFKLLMLGASSKFLLAFVELADIVWCFYRGKLSTESDQERSEIGSSPVSAMPLHLKQIPLF